MAEEISAKLVMELRQKSGAGIMDCKKALIDAEGDMDKASELLRERGIVKAVKKESRIAAEGAIGATIEGNVGVLVEVNCETDFVARTDKFLAAVNTIAKTIASAKPADVDALMECVVDGDTVKSYLTNQTAVIGEKVSVRRFVIYETRGKVETYIHMLGKVGVMVEADPFNEGEETLHDVALQIAASKPSYVRADEVTEEVLEKEKEIMMVQMQNDEKYAGKPQDVIEKIVAGKMGKFYSENCLLNQAFVKDDSQTVEKVIGKKFNVVRFTRWETGEGLEKKSNDLNAEVAEQVASMKK
ncbi:MAG: translation elongation factor Ts [Clostridia bacterium]|nr:translation elongation factor Ts [Clostridia bacterium]